MPNAIKWQTATLLFVLMHQGRISPIETASLKTCCEYPSRTVITLPELLQIAKAKQVLSKLSGCELLFCPLLLSPFPHPVQILMFNYFQICFVDDFRMECIA